MTNVLLSELMPHRSLPELQVFLGSVARQDELSDQLFEMLLTVAEYRDAQDWATAVRICEALAIIGWGSRERVDAISHFNGDCWETFFVNARGAYRYREGRWRKRKAGWLLFNPQYHFSSDRPTVQAQSWKVFAGVEFPVVPADNLSSQRNYQKQMPIIMGGVGGANVDADEAFNLAQELTEVLRDSLRPNEYGDALEHFYLSLDCPGSGSKNSPGLKVGAYKAAHASFYCTLTFPEKFAGWPASKKREFFAIALQTATDSLGRKLAKQTQQYDLPAFRADLSAALSRWLSRGE